MIASLALAGLAATAETAAETDHWAVLVAGSNTYANYRHQADICHAYQVVRAKGIPADHIITMAYDDVASSAENPFPGKLFNKPTAEGVAGTDVYAGCAIDYRGKYVTPETFIKVLTGDNSTATLVEEDAQSGRKCGLFHSNTTCAAKETCCCTDQKLFSCAAWSCCGGNQACVQDDHAKAQVCQTQSTGRVLGSTKSSRVFVNFVDHGGVGLIAFPTGQRSMHAKELVGTLQTMHDKVRSRAQWQERRAARRKPRYRPHDTALTTPTALTAPTAPTAPMHPPHPPQPPQPPQPHQPPNHPNHARLPPHYAALACDRLHAGKLVLFLCVMRGK